MLLTHGQMLAHWRRAHGYGAMRTDCTIDTLGGYDIDAAFAVEMRQWYLALLDNGPRGLVETEDIAGTIDGERCGASMRRYALPPDVRRVLSVEITGAVAPVIVGGDPKRALTLADNPYSVPEGANALAFVRSGYLYVICRNCPDVKCIHAVTDPGPEYYRMDESALQYMNVIYKPMP